MALYILIGAMGLATGFLSGLLGIGGGIIMAPLLLYVPPLFGFAALPMRVVAGLTIIQALVACVSAGLIHKKFNLVSGKLTIWMGGAIFVAALAGGAGSGFVANSMLLAIFAGLALVASILLFVPNPEDSEHPDVACFSFSRLRAVASAGAVGLLGGLVGQGGSFILIPVMISYVNVPTRIAIGSNLAIVFLSSLAAFIGKAATGQIEWFMAVPIVLSVAPAAWLGGLASRHVSIVGLRRLLAAVIGLAAIRIGFSVFIG
ncbi:MAG: sulfite exporter TauE/SafE family protein [Deltaproteobacteria bacterium]|nr:sulfite exporter TauE/SafE family protein [Deltaproteobacteria bacterium]